MLLSDPEFAAIEYDVTYSSYDEESYCDIVQVGEPISLHYYMGFGLPKNSSLATPLNQMIIKAYADGTMMEIEQKYFKKAHGNCEVTSSQLDVSNVAGIFIMLALGLILSCCIGLFELKNNKKEINKE